MKTVLVVGGAGFVGSHIACTLAARGARPVLFGPAMPGAADRLGGQFEQIEGSVLSRHELAAGLRSSDADVIVSCAAYGAGRLGLMRSGEADADAAMDVNVSGLARLLDSAREAGMRRVVWTSSTVVYGRAEDYGAAEVDEGAPTGALTFYGLTKMLAEQVSSYHRRRHGLLVTALRLPLVLGPGLWYEGAAAALMSLFRTPPPASIASHDQPIDLAHVRDVARAVLALLEHPAPAPVYNLEGFRARASELIRAVERRRPGLSMRLEASTPALSLPLVSGARLRADTGFAPEYDLDRFVDAMLEDAQ